MSGLIHVRVINILRRQRTNIDADSFRTRSRATDQLSVEQADGTRLLSAGIGTLAGAPAYVIPAMADTILGANAVCKLGNHVGR